MTPHEQAALDGIDLDRGTAHVDAILHKQHEHGGPPMTLREVMEAEIPAPKTSRKPRSDKGKPKPPKPAPAPEGKLTREQRRELEVRISGMIRMREEMERAIAESDKAQQYYESYLDSLTAQS